jgi:hypothetical protein
MGRAAREDVVQSPNSAERLGKVKEKRGLRGPEGGARRSGGY